MSQHQKHFQPAASEPLGKVVNNVDAEPEKEPRDPARLDRFAAKRKAATLLRDVLPKQAKRISDCCYVSRSENVTLSEIQHKSGEKTAVWGGLVTCQNVWSCPVCSYRISQDRRAELNALLAWARAQSQSVFMLTLTHRHGQKDVLTENLNAMKKALKSYRQSRVWRSLGLTGTVTATETTYSYANGWHVHYHIIVIAKLPEFDAQAAIEGTRAEWLRSLKKAGLTGNEHAFQLQPATQAGAYVAKFGAAEELALGHKKQGRGGSRTPWQLLADARDGDWRSGELFKEYAKAFRGRRQLVWSNGLKALAGVEETVKAEAEAEAEQSSPPVLVRAWRGGGDQWRQARRRRVALTDAIEQGKDLDQAEYGPTDAERWRKHVANSLVVDPDDHDGAAI